MCRTNTSELSYEEEEEKEYEWEGWLETERERECAHGEICSTSGKETPVSSAQRGKKSISADKGNMDASEKYPCAFRMELTIRPLCT